MLRIDSAIRHKWLLAGIILLFGFAVIRMVSAVELKPVEPGTDTDPLVSQSYVDEKILELKKSEDVVNEQLLKELAKKTEELEAVSKKFEETGKQFEAIEKQFEDVKELLNLAVQQSVKFVIVENLKAGQKLIADESTEIILRAGKVKAIASEKGGLSDVTAGKDIKQGEAVQANHLIIVPRTDGRGVISEVDAVLMVKGTFRIE